MTEPFDNQPAGGVSVANPDQPQSAPAVSAPAPVQQALSESDKADSYDAYLAGDIPAAAKLAGYDGDPAMLGAEAKRVEQAKDSSRLALSLSLGGPDGGDERLQPEQAQRVYDAAKASGVPFPVAYHNLDELEKYTKAPDFDPATFQKSAPFMAARAASDPTIAAMMRPDMDKLGYIEGFIQSIHRGVYNVDVGQEALQSTQAKDAGGFDYGATSRWQALQSQINTVPQGYAHGVAGWFDALGEFAGTKFEEGTPQALAALLNPATGSAAIGAYHKASLGANWMELEGATHPDGTPYSPALRMQVAEATTAVGMAGDVASVLPGVGGLVGRGVGGVVKWGANRLLAQSFVDAVTHSPSLLARVGSHVAQTALGVADVGAFGAAQGGATTLATKLDEIRDQEQQHRDMGTTWGGTARDSLEGAWHGALDQMETMGIPTVIGHGIGAYVDLRRAVYQAHAAQQSGTALAETGIYKRGGPASKDLMQGMHDHYQTPDVHVPRADWDGYWKDRGGDPAAMAATIAGDHGTEYQNATAENRDLRFNPTSFQHGLMTSEEHAPYFASVAKFDGAGSLSRAVALSHVVAGDSAASAAGGYREDAPEKAATGPESATAETPAIPDPAHEAEVTQKREDAVQSAGKKLAAVQTEAAKATGLPYEFQWHPTAEKAIPVPLPEASGGPEGIAPTADKSGGETGQPVSGQPDKASPEAVQEAREKLNAAKAERGTPIPPKPVEGEPAKPRDLVAETHHRLAANMENMVRTGDYGVPKEELPKVVQVVRTVAEAMRAAGHIMDPKEITWITDHLTNDSSREETLRVLRESMQRNAPEVAGVKARPDVPEGVRIAPDGSVEISDKVPRFQEKDGALVDVHQEVADLMEHAKAGMDPREIEAHFEKEIAPLIEKHMELTGPESIEPEVHALGGGKPVRHSKVPVKLFGVPITTLRIGAGPSPGPGIFRSSSLGRAIADKFAPILSEAEKVRNILAPQTAGGAARFAAGSLREALATAARQADIIDHFLEESRRAFLSESVANNRDFIDRMEHGHRQDPRKPWLQNIANTLRMIDDQDRMTIQGLGTGKLQSWITNHFPHRYTPESIAAVTSKGRLLPDGFAKRRSIPTLKDAIAQGLEPLSNNPVDFIRMQHREMQHYAAMARMVGEYHDSGQSHFVPAGSAAPDGYAVPGMNHGRADSAFTVFGPPGVPFTEHVDRNVWNNLGKLLAHFGISHERVASTGRGTLGYSVNPPVHPLGAPMHSMTGGTIATRAGTTMAVLAHEIGHQLDARYKFTTMLLAGRAARAEGKLVMESRFDPAHPPGPADRAWSRLPTERAASIIEMYIHNRAMLRSLAPKVTERLETFIDNNPDVEPLRQAVPGLGTHKVTTDIEHGGLLTMGHYAIPKEAAAILDNYLSPGLRGSATVRGFQAASNALTGAQLGVSMFHLGFTTIDAATSQLALAFQYGADGNLGKAALAAAHLPWSPIRSLMMGRRGIQEWQNPGSTNAPTARIINALETGGTRYKMDDFLRPKFVDRFMDAYHAGNVGAMALHALPALGTMVTHGIMTKWVPAMKMGVAMEMARRELENDPRLTDIDRRTDLRTVMGKVQDSVDNRLGEMVYDNLHWNKVAKDIGMLSVRALGWNLGTWRELGGGMYDFVGTAHQLSKGKWTGLSSRQAYVMALPLLAGTMGASMMYMLTGQSPQELKDYFFPKIGGKDENGDDRRVSIPSYMKDVFEISHDPGQTAVNKLNPLISAMADMYQNKDYYGTKIRNEDDPLVQQALSAVKYGAKQFEPFSLQGSQRSGGAASLLGFPPAPYFIRATQAEQTASELARSHAPVGGRTQAQADTAEANRDLVMRLRSDDAATRAQAVTELRGKSVREAKELWQRSQTPRLDYEVEHLDPNDAMKVWAVANDREKGQINALIWNKIQRSRSIDPADRIRWNHAIEQYTPGKTP